MARASARWNFRSSWRKRSSWRRKSSLAASSRWRSIVSAIAAKSSSLACTAASCATRGSSSRRASSTPGDLAEADLLAAAQQLARHQLGGHEDAARLAAAHLEHARLGQHLDRLAQGRAADPHLRGQLALGGQAVADVQVAGLDLLGDLLDGLLEGPARRDGLERALQTGASICARGRERGVTLARLHPLERLALGHLERRGALGRGRGDRARRAAPSRASMQLGLVAAAVAVPLARHVDQAAAVGEEVGHVEDAARRRGVRATSRLGERVVGGAGHHAAVERARERVVDQAAGGAGREHVELERQDRLGRRGDLAAVLGREALGSARRRGRSRPRRAPAAASRAASAQPTLPRPITPTRRPSSSSRAGGRGQAAPHRPEDRLGGDRGGVAAAAAFRGAPDHVAGEAAP